MDVQLASVPEAPGQARDAVAPLLGRIGERTHADLRLVVSELVTNAVIHAPGQPIRVSVDVDEEGVVRGEIQDRGAGGVRLRTTTPGDPGGYGLGIVDALADDWGVGDGSTLVWFELRDTSTAH
jgi:anti-sigma regulatory factor (Ser/Thr protein kinase)